MKTLLSFFLLLSIAYAQDGICVRSNDLSGGVAANVQKLNVSWFRKDIFASQNRYFPDRIYAQAKAAGLTWLPILTQNFDGSNVVPHDPAKQDAWVAWAAQQIDNYPEPLYEVWNEPDLQGSDPVDYANLVIKLNKARPNARLLPPVTWTIDYAGAPKALAWMKTFLAVPGVQQAFWGLSCHIYESAASYPVTSQPITHKPWIQRLYTDMARFMALCPGKPVYVTELGSWKVLDPTVAAAREIAQYGTLMALRVAGVFPYALTGTNDPTQCWDHIDGNGNLTLLGIAWAGRGR